MYIALCDDQAEELDAMMDMLAQWQRERQASIQVKVFPSADELLDAAKKEPFTLYLLDVMMPGISGMEAARAIRDFDSVASIVFLTSSPSFAYESYGVRALDYLLKPISSKNLFPILDRLFRKENKPLEGLTIKSGSTLIRIPFFHLSYVEVNGKHLYFNLTDGSVREIFGALSDYEPQLLSRPEFMRIHRSYIVNMLHVSELSSANLRTFAGATLPVSRRLYPQLQKDYMKLLFSQREE